MYEDLELVLVLVLKDITPCNCENLTNIYLVPIGTDSREINSCPFIGDLFKREGLQPFNYQLDLTKSQGLGPPDYKHVSTYKQSKVNNPRQISDAVANEVLQPIILIVGD